MFYRATIKGLDYIEQGIEQYEKQWQEQQLKLLYKKAKELNFELTPIT